MPNPPVRPHSTPRPHGRRALVLLRAAIILLALPASSLAPAASITLQQDTATAIVASRLFTDNGRRIISGSIASCSYVYLEQPQITFHDRRLVLRVHLVGQVGVRSGSGCLGTGDAFHTTVSGQPYVTGERVGLREFRMDEGKPEYRRLLEPLLQQQIPALLSFNLREELNRLLAKNATELRLTLQQFQLQEVKVADGQLALRFDFALQAGQP